MLTLESRLKAIRKSLGITQSAFGQALGLKQNTIATYEMGRTSPSDRTLSDICRVYGVDELWLRTGAGDMFRQMSRGEEIASFMGDVLGSPETDFRQRLIAALSQLSPEEWRMLENVTNKLLDGVRDPKTEKG